MFSSANLHRICRLEVTPDRPQPRQKQPFGKLCEIRRRPPPQSNTPATTCKINKFIKTSINIHLIKESTRGTFSRRSRGKLAKYLGPFPEGLRSRLRTRRRKSGVEEVGSSVINHRLNYNKILTLTARGKQIFRVHDSEGRKEIVRGDVRF